MSNDIIIAKDRNGKVLKFSGIEDWNEMLIDFKECMSRNNHAGVLSNNVYDEPIVPIAALGRLAGTGGLPPLPTDARDVADFKKVIKSWNNSCVIVLCSLLAILSHDIVCAIKASGLNVKLVNKPNIPLIID